VAGVATFAGCGITLGTQGNFTLTAAATGLTTATSPGLTVAGNASKLVYTIQPSGGTHGVAFGTQPVVDVEDSSGDIVTTSTAAVTLAITGGTGTGGAVLSCTSDPVAASGGVAPFAGCSINLAGAGYTLSATGTGVTAATSVAFTET